MNREYKFRGLDLSGNWVYGYFTKDYSGTAYITSLDGQDTSVVREESVGQFAELKDKNGKDIYEGDIVEAWSAGSKGVFEVRWRQEGAPMWLLYPNFQNRHHWNISSTEYRKDKILMDVSGKRAGKDKIGFYDDGLLVIGNIHENPELLKGGKTDVK